MVRKYFGAGVSVACHHFAASAQNCQPRVTMVIPSQPVSRRIRSAQ
jgi:hypothetical protein